MPDAIYPLLRRHRRHRRRRFRRPEFAIREHARLLATGTLAVVLAATAVGSLLHQPRPDARRALRDALITLGAGNYSAARTNAKAAIAADPRMAMAHAVLARAYLELGDGLASEAELTRAADAGLSPVRTHQLMAHARLLQGDPDGALAEAARAPPRYAGYAARIRALALAAQGNRKQALALLDDILDRAPYDFAAWTDLGRIRLDAGDVGGASDAAAHAVVLAPREPAALTLRGEVARARLGLEAAKPWFARALRRDAYYHPALIEYAATLGDSGRYAEMLAMTRAAMMARPGSPQAVYLQAVIAARAGRIDLARSLLDRARGGIGDLPGALLLRGMVDYATGKYQQAIGSWRQLLTIQPMNLAVRRLLAAALLRSGDARGVIDVLRPIVLRDDADRYALLVYSRALEVTGDRAASAAAFDRAMTEVHGPSTTFATDESVDMLIADTVGSPDDPGYALGLIRGLAGRGDLSGAIDRARDLAVRHPGAPSALLSLGDMLSVAGRPDDAGAIYQHAANLRFDEPTMLRLVDAIARAGRPRAAAEALALYLAQNHQSVAGRRLLGHWQTAAGNWNAAIETLEGVRRSAGNRETGLLADLALAYAGAGDGVVARRYGSAAYALAPMDPIVANAYGVALAADGAAGSARQLFAKAAVLAPNEFRTTSHRTRIGG